ILYNYVAEDAAKVELGPAHEHNRSAVSRSANRYLKRIRDGNMPLRLIQPDLSQMTWCFEAVFDYPDDGRAFVQASLAALQPWPVCQDPFSTYRSGFEVRSYRLCRRVLMFHHFPDELGVPDYLDHHNQHRHDLCKDSARDSLGVHRSVGTDLWPYPLHRYIKD